MNYKEYLADLGPVESFDPKAFVGDDQTPQMVCNFVLALALAYNDLRDVLFALNLLEEQNPHSEELSPQTLQHRGLFIGLMRALSGILHELLKLIKDNKNTLKEEAFKKVVNRLTLAGREYWNSVQSVARGQDLKLPLAKALVKVRDKVSFHYDQKTLYRNYHERFVSKSDTNQPYLSRGENMAGTRFYFADATAEETVLGKIPPDFLISSMDKEGVLGKLNQAINEIVTRWPATRNFGWRPVRPRR